MHLKILVSVGLALCLSSFAFASGNPPIKNFTYRVELPSSSAGCDAHARQVASDFVKSSESLQNLLIQNVSATCTGTRTLTDNDGSTYSVDTIVTSYWAKDQIFPYRAFYSNRGILEDSPTNGAGLFESYLACLAELPKQEAIFSKETGLKLFSSYCAQDDSGGHTYALILEAFGVPARVLYAYKSEGAIYENSIDEIHAQELAFTRSGGHLAYSDSTHVFYYAPQEISLTELILGFYTDSSQCTMQLAEAQKVVSAWNFDNGTAICAGERQNFILEIIASGLTYSRPELDRSDRYKTFSDCMSDKARVVQNITSAGGKVTASVCREDESASTDYVIDLYFPARLP